MIQLKSTKRQLFLLVEIVKNSNVFIFVDYPIYFLTRQLYLNTDQPQTWSFPLSPIKYGRIPTILKSNVASNSYN